MRGACDETLAEARLRENDEALGGMRSPLRAAAELASPDRFLAATRPLDCLAEHKPVEQWATHLLKDEAPAVEAPGALSELQMHGLRMTLARTLGVPEPPSGRRTEG